jgi:hypothetical protein
MHKQHLLESVPVRHELKSFAARCQAAGQGQTGGTSHPQAYSMQRDPTIFSVNLWSEHCRSVRHKGNARDSGDVIRLKLIAKDCHSLF